MSDTETSVVSGASRSRRIAQVVVTLAVLAALAYAVVRNRAEFADTWTEIGVRGAVIALLLGIVNGLFTWMQWRTVLSGLGVEIARDASARVFFLSQLGKYVPGSVWPLVLQSESVRRYGAGRKTVVAGNLIVIAVSLTVGLLIAGVLLPFSVPSALGRFWWVLAALPLLGVAIHPSALPGLVDRGLRRLGRQPLEIRLPAGSTTRAMGWSLLAWLAVGAQTTVLCWALGADGPGLIALCIGGTALAVSAGVLVVPAPAGAGPRELILTYVLGTVLSGGAAFAVVIAARVTLICADVLLAAAALALTIRRRPTRLPDQLPD